MEQPTVVLIAYNRPAAFENLLTGVAAARYPDGVNLVVSLDGGADEKVIDLAENFQWKFGEIILIKHPQNLGLKKHILSCGDLTEKYGPVIMLEDDIEVSPAYYQYAQLVLNAYRNQTEKLAGFSLYSYQIAEPALAPMYHIANDPNPVYLMQYPSTWGQLFTVEQWLGFRKWLSENETTEVPLPGFVRSWSTGSWKRDLLRYMIHQHKLFVYPYQSYTSNSGHRGVNLSMDTDLFQVPLSNNVPEYLPEMDVLTAYDAHFEAPPETFEQILHVKGLIIDLYGTKILPEGTGTMVLSSRDTSYAKAKKVSVESLPVKGFSKTDTLYLAPANTFAEPVTPLIENLLYNRALLNGTAQSGVLNRAVFLLRYRIRNYYKVLLKAVRRK